MEQKNSEQKTAQILYIIIIMVLLIMAVTVGLVSAANKAKESPVSTTKPPVVTSTAPKAEATSNTTASTAKTVETTTPAVTKPIQTTEKVTSDKATISEPEPLSLPTFVMPADGNISAEFSIDTLVFSNTMEDYRTHNGIDICAPLGQGVYAAADGIVTDVYEHPMMGYTVVISHDGEAETIYHNMDDDIVVSVGDTVKCGDIIGAVGESALIEIAEEPHLHFEMCISGERVNPCDYISGASAVISYEE